MRFFSASIFLFFYHLASSGRFFLQKKDIFHFILLGTTGIAGMNIFIFYSLSLTDSTITSLMMNANGFIIGILGFFLLKERFGFFDIVGLISGLAGCWLIITKGDLSTISHTNLFGNFLAVCASFCWAFYSVWGKKTKLIEKYGAILSTFWPSFFGSFMLLIVILLFNIQWNLSLKNLLIGLYLGVVPAGIGFALWFYSISRLKTVIPGILQFLAPLTTAVIATIFLKQEISLATISGGILILAGVLFSLKDHQQ